MNCKRLVMPTALLLVMFFPMRPVYAADLVTKDIEGELMCQCGCTMVVDVCECETANQMREKITGMIGDGQDKDEILEAFVNQYGEDILSSPPKKGFNLVAWLGPFVIVIAGGTGLFFLLRSWVRRGKTKLALAGSEVSLQPLTADEVEGYRSQLEAELKQFREEGI